MSFLVSVIIPTFRQGPFLARAIASVSAAAGVSGVSDRVELVLGDDGWQVSEAQIAALGREFPRLEIKAVRTARGPGAGPAAARNAAIKASTGWCVFPLDDDDVFLPNRFVTGLALLADGRHDAVLEQTLRTFGDESGAREAITGAPNTTIDPLEMLLSGKWEWSVSQGAVSFTRDIFERVGGYNEGLRFAEDGELLCKFATCGRVALLVGDPVTRYFYHTTNMSAPSNVFPWQNVKMLAALHRFLRNRQCSNEHKVMVADALRSKFDYAMWASWNESQGRALRLAGLWQAFRAYPMGMLSRQNIRSLAVALMRAPLA